MNIMSTYLQEILNSPYLQEVLIPAFLVRQLFSFNIKTYWFYLNLFFLILIDCEKNILTFT